MSRNHVILTISNFPYSTGTSSEPEITAQDVGARKQNKDFTGIQGDGLKFAAPKSSSMHFVKALADKVIVEQWWHSGASTRLPPMWPGFSFQTRRHMWVEFVSSLLCSERFFPGYSGLPLSSKNVHLIQSDLINLICTNDPTSFKL